MKLRLKKEYIFFSLLVLVTAGIIYFTFFYFQTFQQEKYLKVVFLDVGQGDAIYIEAPNKTQMLIDGGVNQQVISQLAKVMPLGDKSINFLVATHPDADHIGGLPGVIDNYKVDGILVNGASSETKIYQTLENKIKQKNIKKIIARQGMRFILDKEKNIYFDILFPDRDISKMESNDGSIVGKLVYGDKSFILTGDATIYSEILIHQTVPDKLKANILKLGHHGAKTSSSVLWLKDVLPDMAIISAGLNNRYKHPSPEILDRLSQLKILYLSTAKEGNIIFETDGIVILKK